MPTTVRPFTRKARLIRAKRTALLGEGQEGVVHRMEYQLESTRGRAKRKIVMAEKTFSEQEKFRRWLNQIFFRAPNFGRPRPQVALMEELIRQNRVGKWGLRLPNTVRLLAGEDGSQRVVSTYAKLLSHLSLSAKQDLQFSSDIIRQQRILREHGYDCYLDSFKPAMNPVAHEVCAVIVDFGTIKKKKK